MGIKNKDGTPYKLSSPSPILSEMAMWDKKDKLILHNIGAKLVSYEEATVVYRNSQPEIVDQLPTPTVQTVKAAPTPDPMDTVDIPEEIPIIDSLDDGVPQVANKVQVWCLPAYFRQYKDDMYEDTVSRVRYGEKFIFEAILDESQDIYLVLYTTTDAVTEGSILYPRTHDKRWWRVMKTEKSEDGLIRIIAQFTDYQPDFS